MLNFLETISGNVCCSCSGTLSLCIYMYTRTHTARKSAQKLARQVSFSAASSLCFSQFFRHPFLQANLVLKIGQFPHRILSRHSLLQNVSFPPQDQICWTNVCGHLCFPETLRKGKKREPFVSIWWFYFAMWRVALDLCL